MKFLDNLTTGGKVVITAVLFLLIAGGIYFGLKDADLTGIAKDHVAGNLKINEDADIVIGYNPFIGAAGLIYMNGGLEPSTESRFYKEYGVKVQIKILEGNESRDALTTGAIDAVYCTIDALPIEMGLSSSLVDAGVKVRAKINESRGADVMVVTSAIKNIGDLKGKSVAYAEGTASHTLLLNILETAGLTMKDINPIIQGTGIDASNAFKAGSVDAALVWSPDDEDCIKAVAGSKAFVSTKTATSIIADGLLITDRTMETKKDLMVKVLKGWLQANGLLNNDLKARTEASKLFAKNFGFDEGVALATVDKVRYSTLGDNKSFFALDPLYTGVKGSDMYTRMSIKYTENKLAKSPKSWDKVSSSDLIESLLEDQTFATAPNQSIEKEVVFTAPTKKEETATAAGSKKVTINFATASFELDDAAKTIINREVVGLTKAIAGSRIRIEGNTDNVGDSKSNLLLSIKRSQSVIKYLVSEHHLDPNRFISKGNGSTVPVCTEDSEDCRAKNRRTEFQFIW